jgi:hypothetical protein
MSNIISFRNIAKPSVTFVALVLGILLAMDQVWHQGFQVTSDGLAYVDIGDAYFNGDWHTAINAHWSPLYSWLLGAAFHLTRPHAQAEGVIVQIVNLLIFGLSFIAFRCFLMEMRLYRISGTQGGQYDTDDTKYLPEWLLDAIGYSLFLWSSITLITVCNVVPDLLVSALSYFMCALVLKIVMDPDDLWPYLALGALAGTSYLAKSAMLIVGPSFLLGPLLFCRPVRTRKIILSGLCFIIVATPFVVALSLSKDRLTFGDTGKYNYIRHVLGVGLPVHWQGTPGIGIPIHPTRRLGENPAIYEFDGPIGGTYSPWHEPSYWVDPGYFPYNARATVRTVVRNLQDYIRIISGRHNDIGLDRSVLACIVCLVAIYPIRRYLREALRYSPLLIPICCALLLYAPVHVESRYVAPFFAVLLVIAFASLRLPSNQIGRGLVFGVASALGVFWIGPLVFSGLQQFYMDLPSIVTARGAPVVYETQGRIAAAINDAGVARNSKVAFIGRSFRLHWARMAGVRIVAEIRQFDVPPESDQSISRDAVQRYTLAARDVDSFWQGATSNRERVYDILMKIGVQAIIAERPASSKLSPDWREIEGTDYCIRLLAKKNCSASQEASSKPMSDTECPPPLAELSPNSHALGISP